MSAVSPTLFRCPVTGAPMRAADDKELAGLNAWLATRPAHVLGDGTSLAPPWQAAWLVLHPDGGFFPVVSGIPVLVPDARISMPSGHEKSPTG
jgi:uncharacterized protein YbaR (Trm112 family)